MLARVVVCVALTMAPLGAQTKPDFSGTWELIPDQSTPERTWALGGARVTITQDAANLHVDVPDAPTGNMTPKELRRVSYRLSENTLAIRSETGAQVAPTSPTATTMRLSESEARITWRGPQLVIVTLNTLMVTAPARYPNPVPLRQMVRQALMVDANGHLVVDAIIVVDPLPGETPMPPPTPIRSVYRKVS